MACVWMFRQWVKVLLLALALAFASCSEEDPTASLPGVVEITQDSFEEVLALRGEKHLLVEFYGPWCGHCQRLTPEYARLAELVADDEELSAQIIMAKVNMDIEYDLGDAFEVSKVPTIKFLPSGQEATNANAEAYTGPRTTEAILEFLKTKLSAAQKVEL